MIEVTGLGQAISGKRRSYRKEFRLGCVGSHFQIIKIIKQLGLLKNIIYLQE